MWKRLLNNSVLLLAVCLVFWGWKVPGERNSVSVATRSPEAYSTPDSAQAPLASESWRVVRVADGDTITVVQGNRKGVWSKIVGGGKLSRK